MTGDLTTLAKVRAHLRIKPADISTDDELKVLITQESQTFKTETRRDILYQRYVEIRDGQGTPGIAPFQYPLQSADSVLVDGVAIPAQPAIAAGDPPGYGYVLSSDRIEIVRPGHNEAFVPDYGGSSFSTTPYRFTQGFGNVVLTYWAGFLVDGEAGTVDPASHSVQAQGNFYSDAGVAFASDGSPLTKVASTPGPNQYSVNETGLYTFNSAEDGDGVLLTYAYVPADIQRAVHRMIARELKSSDHEGQRSKNMGSAGGTVYYETDAYSDSVQRTIDKYARVSL